MSRLVKPSAPQPKAKRRRSGGGSHRIEEVAQAAGVSLITVSRTLNKPDTVSESTRAAVWAAIEKIGYIPNRLAGSLASNHSRTIGLVIPHIGNSTFTDRVRGMTDVLSGQGYNLLLALSGYAPEVEERHVLAFLGQRVAGLSLTGTIHSERTRSLLARAGVPLVETSTITGKPIDMLVGYSNEDACFAMVEHLVRCGYRKVALLSTPSRHNDRTVGRQIGYRRAVKTFGLASDDTLIVEAASDLASGAKAFVTLIARHPDLDAVFCTNDVLAVGALLEARRRDIRVPEDIGIAGFDDIELAQEFVPALTTVRVKRYEIGEIAARMLLQRIGGQQPENPLVDMGFEIVVRASTRRPKAA